MLVSRFDVAEIGKPQLTPQGFLRVPAFVTRAGVLTYRRADGKVVREFRPPDEVFKADSLATLSAAPVTDLHPTEMVTPKNVQKLRVGGVSEVARRDGDLVGTTITVEDESTIAKVQAGDRREVSMGYRCRLDATPGSFNGEPYDVVQRDIVYNHAALGPRNWGRAGRDVALRVDSKDDAPSELFRLDSEDALAASTLAAPKERDDRDDRDDHRGDDDMDTVIIKLDGIDTTVPKTSSQLIEKALATRDGQISTLTKERDTLQGKYDAANTELTDAKKKLTEAVDPKRLDAMVNERTRLVTEAIRVLGAEHKLDGQSERQVHEAVLKKLDDKLDLTGKSDEYVRARYDHAISTLPADDGKGGGTGKKGAGDNSARNDALEAARRAASNNGGAGHSNSNGGGNGGSHERNDAPLPWQQPLSTSKDR